MAILHCNNGMLRIFNDVFDESDIFYIPLEIEDVNKILNNELSNDEIICYINKLNDNSKYNNAFLIEKMFNNTKLTWMGFELYIYKTLRKNIISLEKFYFQDTIDCLKNYNIAFKGYNKYIILVKYNFYKLILNYIVNNKYKKNRLKNHIINKLIYDKFLSYKMNVATFINKHKNIFINHDKHIPYLLKKEHNHNKIFLDSLKLSFAEFTKFMINF